MTITYEQYASMLDDGKRYELVEGVLELMTPSPSVKHQEILIELTAIFLENCRPCGKFYFAPIDVIFAADNVRQPDFVFIRNENLHMVTKKGIEGTPDLVVEILSPSTAKRDRTGKLSTYQYFGVNEYWIIDPELELLEQFILGEKRYVLNKVYESEEMVLSPQLECIHFNLKLLFG